MNTPANQESLIEYPSDFPIKVMGSNHPDFPSQISALVSQIDPSFNDSKMTQRASAKGNYLSLTLTVRATSREQLDSIYRAVTAHPMVKMAL